MTIARRSLLIGSIGLTAGLFAPLSMAIAQQPALARRRGRSIVRGKAIDWTAETGERVIIGTSGRPEATIFAVAYCANGARPATRPVTFVWNGGPGGATWPLREHLSPRITRAAATDTGFAFVDNPDGLIDATDLVFIDAPGTGFSRMLDPDAKPRYWGIEEDGRVFSDFIASWLRSHGRLGSPIYLIAESYGGTRAGQVVRNLAEAGIDLAGVTFVSPALGATEPNFPSGMRSGAALNVAPQAAVAWFHKRGRYGGETIDNVYAAAQRFAGATYGPAVAAYATLGPAERQSVADRLSAFIGLPSEQILKSDLFVPPRMFRTSLLADQGLDVGGSDGRVTRRKALPGQTLSVLDPDGAYDITASIEALIRTDLGYPAVGAYNRNPGEIGRAWNGSTTRSPAVDMILVDQMKRNPSLRVMLVGGYFDTIVPYPMPLAILGAAIPASRLTHHVYPVGHAVYEDIGWRRKTTDDLRNWYGQRAGRR